MSEEQKFDVRQEVAQAIAKFREALPERSFSGRHPELGRMINCKVCGRRHRAIPECVERVLIPTAKTRKGALGAATFVKKRLQPHHSHRLLRLVQLTQDLFSKYFPEQISDPQKAMQAARGEAKAVQRRAYAETRAALQRQQHKSRQINWNLIPGGTR
jgi:hypothetical protein